MRKILAAIVEYRLNKNNLTSLLQKIFMVLNNENVEYPRSFKNELDELLIEIQNVCSQNILSLRDDGSVMDTLKEMELLIVDYLSHSAIKQTNDCILN